MLISRAKRPLRAGVFTHKQADFASKRHIPQLNYCFDLINKIYCSVRSFTLPALTTGALHPVRVLAASFNLLTTQQPWAAERLARHAGKTIRISLKGFAVTLTIDAQGHLEQSDEAVVPDVILDVDPEKIRIAQWFDPNARQDVAELVHISGQAALAQVVTSATCHSVPGSKRSTRARESRRAVIVVDARLRLLSTSAVWASKRFSI